MQSEIPMERVSAFAELVNECDYNDIKIEKVVVREHGFSVWFSGFDAYVFCDDTSVGHECGMWQTCGFPQHINDDGIYTTSELVDFLVNINN